MDEFGPSIHPVINLNGTSSGELVKLNADAWAALNAAMEKVRFAAPHGRDYPIPGSFEAACAQHDEHVRMVESARNYFRRMTEVVAAKRK